jgi:hypothetical protein
MGKSFHAKCQPLEHKVPDGYHSVVADPKEVNGLKYPEYVLLNADQVNAILLLKKFALEVVYMMNETPADPR